MSSVCIIGFDSAWTNRTAGAICALVVDSDGKHHFTPPERVRFDDALKFINRFKAHDARLVAIDQPTIVPNFTKSRPVDRVAASVISYIGGGVQPANRMKKGIFDETAPIWEFRAALGAQECPNLCRVAETGLFVIEVFPALALPTLHAAFFERRKGPKYNPANKAKFQLEHWQEVCRAVSRYACDAEIQGIRDWAYHAEKISAPCKGAQDELDAVLCALVGYQWRIEPREKSVMIGDLESGYMIAPASPSVRERLQMSAAKRGVACL